MQVFSGEDVQNTLDERAALLNNDININTPSHREEDDEPAIDIRSFLIACAANLYEYYDFALLGFFSEEIASSIFPENSPGASAIISLYSLFAVGFISRPFGGVVFGYFGDRYGRRSSLRMSMILMSFPTFLTGCIPSYKYIGWWAPVILLFLRVLQGLSTGGENSSASIYIYESAPKNKRAFWLSVFGICSSGTLIASFAHVILQNTLTDTQLSRWGWRIPFFLGIGLFIFSLWAKKWLKTTETFSKLETSPYIHRNPIKYVCSHNRGLLLKFIFASCIQHGSAYLIFVFLPSFLSSDVMRGREDDGWVNDYAYSINCINSILFLPFCVLVGYYTDRIGSMPFLCISTLIVVFVSPFIFYGLAISESAILDWFLQFCLVIECVPIWGCIFYWYINVLLPDPRTRVTIYGVGYNLGAAIFGGTASLIATSFVEESGPINGMVLSGIWMSVMAIFSIITIGYIEFCEPKESLITIQERVNTKGIKGKYYQTSKRVNSTWYLKKLDTIHEEDEDDGLLDDFSYSDDSSVDSSEERDVASYDQFKSPKVYG